MEKSVSYFK